MSELWDDWHIGYDLDLQPMTVNKQIVLRLCIRSHSLVSYIKQTVTTLCHGETLPFWYWVKITRHIE